MNGISFWSTIEIATTVFETFVIYMFFSNFLGQKNINSIVSFFCFAMFACGLIVINFHFPIPILTILFDISAFFLLSFLFGSGIRTKLFAILILMAFFIASETLALFSIMFLGKINADIVMQQGTMRLIGILISKLITLMLVKVACIYKNNNQVKIPTWYWLLLLLIPLISVLSIHTIFTLNDIFGYSHYSLLSYISVIGILFSNIIIYYLFDTIQEKILANTRCQLLEQQINYQLEHYKNFELSQVETRKLRHDMKNHLLCINDLLKNNNNNEVEDYVKSISEILIKDEYAISTGNPVIDSLLNSKIVLARSNNIEIKKVIQIPSGINIRPIDVCIIWGNALDNALEACNMLDKQKIIELNMCYINNSLICTIINPINDKLHKTGKYYSTSKKDKVVHGFGLENIDNAVTKYNGALNIEQIDNFFKLSFVIPNI